jgi:hypothetical protein
MPRKACQCLVLHHSHTECQRSSTIRKSGQLLHYHVDKVVESDATEHIQCLVLHHCHTKCRSSRPEEVLFSDMMSCSEAAKSPRDDVKQAWLGQLHRGKEISQEPLVCEGCANEGRSLKSRSLESMKAVCANRLA